MAYRSLILLLAILHAPFTNAEKPGSPEYEQEMHEARQQLKHHHGDSKSLSVTIKRLEYQNNEGEPQLSWFARGWYGDDIDKIGFKTEGEYDIDTSEFEQAEIQLLYKHAITAFWDLLLGTRHDIEPQPNRHFLAFGFEGIAPYWFEIDAAGFINDRGLLLRLEIEQDFNITTNLILQPRLELNFAAEEDLAAGRASGLNNADFGLRMHYKINPSFRPYLGVVWAKTLGNTADLKRQENEDTESLSFAAGIKLLF